MATLNKGGRQISVPDTEVDYYLSKGWQSPNAQLPPAPAFPEGDPASSWKAAELKAYAVEHDVDLGDATSKKDIVPILLASRVQEPAQPPAGTESS